MIEVTKYRHQKVAVYGLGRTGCAAIYSLLAGGAKVVAWDDNPERRKKWQNNLDPAHLIYSVKRVLSDPTKSKRWKDIDLLVLTPGIPIEFPEPHSIVKFARSINCRVISDIELLFETYRTAKYIGITGTNGKSTSTSLIGHISKELNIRHQIGGNIGISALELDPLNQDGFYILELSSYQIDLFKNMHLNIAVLLNITPDHLEYHGNMENYINTKIRIFENQQKNDIAVISIDCPVSFTIYQELIKVSKALIIPISTKKTVRGGISVIDYKIYDYTDLSLNDAKMISSVDNFYHLPGVHNQENIAASYAVTTNFINDKKKIISAINSFIALPHRLEYLGKKNNIIFINDSKATNAKSTENALKTFDNIFWILGGIKKEGGIKILLPYLNKVKHVFLIGDSQDEFAEILKGKISFTKCHTLESAFTQAIEKAKEEQKDITLLLSPSCASFDQWSSFEERGDSFKNHAMKYINNERS